VKADEVVRRSERAVFRELAGNEGGVLLHLDTGAYHGLNPTGTLIWNLIGDGSTFANLVEGLRSQLTDTPADLEADVEAFVQDLLERDLLTVSLK
jgi:hypothetical protein